MWPSRKFRLSHLSTSSWKSSMTPYTWIGGWGGVKRELFVWVKVINFWQVQFNSHKKISRGWGRGEARFIVIFYWWQNISMWKVIYSVKMKNLHQMFPNQLVLPKGSFAWPTVEGKSNAVDLFHRLICMSTWAQWIYKRFQFKFFCIK